MRTCTFGGKARKAQLAPRGLEDYPLLATNSETRNALLAVDVYYSWLQRAMVAAAEEAAEVWDAVGADSAAMFYLTDSPL